MSREKYCRPAFVIVDEYDVPMAKALGACAERMPLMPLRIPNRSVQVVFHREVWGYFDGRVDDASVRDLADALWAGEATE